MSITVRTCHFVLFSEVFSGLSLARNVFINGDPECSWGNNNRTMITAQQIIENIEDEGDGDETKVEIGTAVERLKSIPEGVYIDLEN